MMDVPIFFKIQHTLKLKAGGLLIGYQNKVLNTPAIIEAKYFTSYSVQNKSLISSSWYGKGTIHKNSPPNPHWNNHQASIEIYRYLIYGNSKLTPYFMSE